MFFLQIGHCLSLVYADQIGQPLPKQSGAVGVAVWDVQLLLHCHLMA